MDKECTTCAEQNPAVATFCRRCGHRLEESHSHRSAGRAKRPWTAQEVWLFLCFGPLAWLFPGFRRP